MMNNTIGVIIYSDEDLNNRRDYISGKSNCMNNFNEPLGLGLGLGLGSKFTFTLHSYEYSIPVKYIRINFLSRFNSSRYFTISRF